MILLRLIARDWMRAPISHTAALVGLAGAAVNFPTDRGLLYLIMALVCVRVDRI